MMWQMQEPFAQRYNLHSASERAVGGSGVLQGVTDSTTGVRRMPPVLFTLRCSSNGSNSRFSWTRWLRHTLYTQFAL